MLITTIPTNHREIHKQASIGSSSKGSLGAAHQATSGTSHTHNATANVYTFPSIHILSYNDDEGFAQAPGVLLDWLPYKYFSIRITESIDLCSRPQFHPVPAQRSVSTGPPLMLQKALNTESSEGHSNCFHFKRRFLCSSQLNCLYLSSISQYCPSCEGAP